jgi:hypothetical protein
VKEQYTYLNLYAAALGCLVLSDLKDRGLTLNSIWQNIMVVTFSLLNLLYKDYMIYDLIRIVHSSHLMQPLFNSICH